MTIFAWSLSIVVGYFIFFAQTFLPRKHAFFWSYQLRFVQVDAQHSGGRQTDLAKNFVELFRGWVLLGPGETDHGTQFPSRSHESRDRLKCSHGRILGVSAEDPEFVGVRQKFAVDVAAQVFDCVVMQLASPSRVGTVQFLGSHLCWFLFCSHASTSNLARSSSK